ncbi:MAG: ABC transporter permease [Nitrososphaerales archaeon]
MMILLSDAYWVFWRELKRYSRSRVGIIIRIVQPAAWLILIGSTFAGTQPLLTDTGYSGSYIEYITPGIIMLTAIFSSIFGGASTLWDRRFGYMNKLLTTPISRTSIALGKMFGISIISAIQASMIVAIALLMGIRLGDPLGLVPAMLVIIAFSMGLAGASLIAAVLARSQESFWAMMNFLGMPLFMLSSALFPLELMPDWLAIVVQFNPLTYTIELVRALIIGEVISSISLALDISVLISFVIAATVVAAYMFKREVSKPF